MFRRPRLRSVTRAALSLALLALVAACSSDDGPPPGCPRTDFVTDLDHVTVFTDGAVGDLTDVRFDARFGSLSAVCNFDSDALAMDIGFQVVATRGPANRDNKADVTYFLAIADETGAVIAKEVFEASLPFKGNLRRVAITDEFEPTIPYPANRLTLNNYRVMIGFQLTQEQLAYNRSQRR
ncbi:hypothetical protein NUH88_15040 [Nisaea acidiphila]|uniref:Uncharacterized protein n=1 Tax=Nisaea acidiphila TaxID=1862145 RepID=A0A9J7ANH9_9PROT|nr:hypothetical protein [Nisaea acidiphila]UUX48718.1 hypothetical protein NUH88_15040 [Nisaea acidiphila]